MHLTDSQLGQYRKNGYLLHDKRIAPDKLNDLLAELDTAAVATETVVFEADGITPRSVHGSHSGRPVFDRLSKLSLLVTPAEQLLESPVYNYQFKINFKAAFTGDAWPWHQDYSFWANEDGMPTTRALTVAILLDESTQFNGPLYIIPQSHGLSDANRTDAETSHNWEQHVSSKLAYQCDRNWVAKLARQYGMVAQTGPAGSIFFFHSDVVHASPGNITPFDRRTIYITYNSVQNIPQSLNRPEFLVHRDTRPIVAVDECWTS